jgi:Ca2+-binding RTX toxin-like protein
MIDGAHAFDDKYFGGVGFDNVRWIGGLPVTVDLRTGQATGHGSDLLASIEHIDGGEGADTLIGNGAPNEIHGFGGNDQIEGRAGDDLLNGGHGTDSINGGRGGDICRRGETVVNCEFN